MGVYIYMCKKLELNGKVRCFVCGHIYSWKETDTDVKVYVTDPGHENNGVHEDVYVDVYSRCSECCNYNNHKNIKINIIHE